jgi:hypothetical protein
MANAQGFILELMRWQASIDTRHTTGHGGAGRGMIEVGNEEETLTESGQARGVCSDTGEVVRSSFVRGRA